MTAVHLFLADHKATTINRVIAAVKAFRARDREPGVTIRLASGNAGVQAAVNDEVGRVRAADDALRVRGDHGARGADVPRLRAVVACCLPLTWAPSSATGSWKELEIGLTVATLPVMVLAVGIGVDYAFYIYNRLQLHPPAARTSSRRSAVDPRGRHATIFTAITLARRGDVDRSRRSSSRPTWQVARLHVHGQHGDGDDCVAGLRGAAGTPFPRRVARAGGIPWRTGLREWDMNAFSTPRCVRFFATRIAACCAAPARARRPRRR